ncbi:hypothetical protein [Mongoliitalea daihaiensis]|uniref:hypothetical protein n=1 Tax=Mongoliitalea daihaiensis TaxID=2782006 RepID=UPI001F2F5DC5|nr:hypothetical protein [Mongoliitalea daihaiensis]UJP63574.1 hypothetical protein IPZ59_12065 [Mongoliitalea daihaiensis]
MDIKEVVAVLKQKGRVSIQEGNGKVLEFISLNAWDSQKDDPNGIFLLFETFQIRTISEQFSEVSLDVVEFATKPTIYHTIAGRMLQNGPRQNGQVKFSLIKSDVWNRLLFSFGQSLILQYASHKESDFQMAEYFPLLSPNAKEMYLSPDGDIKIIRA